MLHPKHQLITGTNTERRLQIQSKIIITRISFFSQKIRTMIPFAIGMVDVSFLKKLDERPAIKDQNTTRVRHNGLIIMGCQNNYHNFFINLNNELSDIEVYC